MADQDWIGNPPEDPYWSDDGRAVYYEREREGIGRNQRKDLYRVESPGAREAGAGRARPARRADAPGERNRERTRKVYLVNGDVFLKDLKTGAVRQVTRTGEVDQRSSLPGRWQADLVPRGDDVLVYDPESGITFQAADLRLAKDPAEKDPKFLAEQQTRLFDVIRQKQEKEKRDREEDRRSASPIPPRAPLPWYLGKEVRSSTTALSPSGDWLAVVTAPKRDEDARG